LHAWVAFALPIKLFLSQLTSFLTFILSILSLFPLGGGGILESKQLCEALPTGFNPQHFAESRPSG